MSTPRIAVASWHPAGESAMLVSAEAHSEEMVAWAKSVRLDSPVRAHPVLGWFDSEKPMYSLAKRVFDVAVAALLIFLLVPVLAMVSLLLLLEGTQPVLYRQRRIGRGGQVFWMLKFRTMRPDRRQRFQPIDFGERRRHMKVAHDPRITPFGAFLRRTSLDELPQLWHVVVGDMSLVGPRPELLSMLRFYEEDRHFVRHEVTPGLTGWWQVNARTNRQAEVDPIEDLEGKVRDDAHYVVNRSFRLDLEILFRTVLVVLGRRGAF